ncbi:unnamed protein product [Ixodes persulcatus]
MTVINQLYVQTGVRTSNPVHIRRTGHKNRVHVQDGCARHASKRDFGSDINRATFEFKAKNVTTAKYRARASVKTSARPPHCERLKTKQRADRAPTPDFRELTEELLLVNRFSHPTVCPFRTFALVLALRLT